LKLLANPTANQSQEYTERIVTWAREQGLSLTGATTAFIANTLLGIAIMVVAIYFFLLDGPQMIAAVRKLSPMDKDHERELLLEFSRVSRAVVLATLLAAIVQGLLAGAGFIIFGVDNVFLLTVLTIALAMIPFVGAAAVWAPIAVSLYLFDGRPMAAVGLALYGTLIVSMADNVVKPMVLHGQSNLHPLFALLSVLGGVTALGPIGILIGPMITAFLQTLLEILQRELTRLPAPVATVTAGASVNTNSVNSEGSNTRSFGPNSRDVPDSPVLPDGDLNSTPTTSTTPTQQTSTKVTSNKVTSNQANPKKGKSKR
jgi:predicted PurR-regulated permease PerM